MPITVIHHYAIGQRVIFRDKVRNKIYDVICTICASETTPESDQQDDDNVIWIYNPARCYKHWTSVDNVKPLPGGQL